MALTSAYMISSKNVEAILDAIKNAQAPDRFTQRYLVGLGFGSKSDRTILSVLKALGFLDDTGAPTQRYFDYLDPAASGTVLASGIREAYEDLFKVNRNAQEMSPTAVAAKLKVLTQGKKSESVLKKMATTFATLASLADFAMPSATAAPENTQDAPPPDIPESVNPDVVRASGGLTQLGLSYDIHIHLPVTRDPAVYGALFKSLREHLL